MKTTWFQTFLDFHFFVVRDDSSSSIGKKIVNFTIMFFFTVEHLGGSSRGTQRLEVDDEMVMHILLDTF